ncbi:hypothetical protein CJF42_26225, partial [Pseudoalteromonas sp. NBT06-2]|uniref:hypothetical protein n=1 Tax=Pseudoalteromonas sp. NBT06-2 TaxID=2025950 RepID=UPI000BC74FC7
TIQQTLVQDKTYSTYSFKATDGNTLENVIEKTSFSLSDDEEYIVFSYLDQNEDSQLEPTLGTVFVKGEDIDDNQYRVIIMHIFSSNTELLDVYTQTTSK